MAVLLFMGCSKNRGGQNGDDQITLQVQQVKEKNAEDLAFRIRVFAHLPADFKDRKQLNEKMEYGIDSCFFRLNRGKQELPSGVIPVANGIKDCFEYVLLFSGSVADKNEQLVYRDKYISGKTYQVILK